MYYFCTYFDHRYLARGLALYESLRRHCPSFQLWVLCLDRTCYDILSQLGLANVKLIALEDFEKGDQDLLKAKQNRSMVEYYFTCTPSLPLFILNNCPEVGLITYLDADLFFFADPAPIYDEIADHSIAIIGHRFPPNLRELERVGIYNVGWLSFRRDVNAFACLSWWRERCIEWCYDQWGDGRFADQKYLDDWPSRFEGVVVLGNKGANLAPWNLGNYKIYENGDCAWVDEQPLICFHFHGFKQLRSWLYDPYFVSYKVRPSKVIRRSIVSPYILTLRQVNRRVSGLSQTDFLQSSARDQLGHSPSGGSLLRYWISWLKRFCDGEFIVVINGRVM